MLSACVSVCLRFELAGQFVKFERKIRILKLINFFNFYYNGYLSLQTREPTQKLSDSFTT